MLLNRELFIGRLAGRASSCAGVIRTDQVAGLLRMPRLRVANNKLRVAVQMHVVAAHILTHDAYAKQNHAPEEPIGRVEFLIVIRVFDPWQQPCQLCKHTIAQSRQRHDNTQNRHQPQRIKGKRHEHISPERDQLAETIPRLPTLTRLVLHRHHADVSRNPENDRIQIRIRWISTSSTFIA